MRASFFLLFVPFASALLRVALYIGPGTAPTSAGNYTASLQDWVAAGKLQSLTTLLPPDVATLSPQAFDLVVFPGGGSSSEAAAIGAQGAAAVRAFVAAGKGYLGTCAGGYLAGNASCCAQKMAGYCGGGVGCAPSPYALGLINMGVAEPWDRGHGLVEMSFSASAVAMLQLDVETYGGGRNVSILYYQGPIQYRGYAGGYTVDAVFNSEIHSGHPQWTTGEMVHTPSLIHATYGSAGGRVLISSPHPEETIPRLNDLILQYARWAGGEI